MISIVICSIDPVQLAEVRSNIAATIGIPYEVIAIDNRNSSKGICEVYNNGASVAKFAIVCFMHEDICIKTENWGKIVLSIFDKNPKAGIVGVAGGGYKSLTPSGWYNVDFQHAEKSFQNIIQGYKYNMKENFHALHNPLVEKLSEVVCVDGVWLCTRKELVLEKPFDQTLLTGFHGYDVDFCLHHFGVYQIFVTYEILLIHFSEGNFTKLWLDEVLKLHHKWRSYLPLTTVKLSQKEIYHTEKRTLKRLIEQMLIWEYSYLDIHKMLLVICKSNQLPARLFYKGYLHFLQLKTRLKKVTLVK